jgi:REP element-mobilizing transposase RayT
MGTAYYHRRRLPHYQPDDKPLLVNFRTARTVVLSPEARTLVPESCLHEHLKRVRLFAAVVMPDHVHLLFTPLRDDETRSYELAKIVQAIKSVSARRINQHTGHLGPIWQEEYFDHVIRSYESLRGRIEYIRMNPVRKGLAVTPRDYRWLWLGYEVIE